MTVFPPMWYELTIPAGRASVLPEREPRGTPHVLASGPPLGRALRRLATRKSPGGLPVRAAAGGPAPRGRLVLESGGR